MRLGAASRAVPSSRAGSKSQLAYTKLRPRPNAVVRDSLGAVVMVMILVAVLEFAVSEAGLKVQPASGGSPLHEKLIELLNVPWGVTVSVDTPDCPTATVMLLELTDRENADAFTV